LRLFETSIITFWERHLLDTCRKETYFCRKEKKQYFMKSKNPKNQQNIEVTELTVNERLQQLRQKLQKRNWALKKILSYFLNADKADDTKKDKNDESHRPETLQK